MGDEALKDCPSCGSRIAESAVRCSFCKSRLGHCLGCGQWLVVGIQCFDCGKTTAERVRPAAAAASKEEAEPPPITFDGSALGVLPPLLLRTALLAACAGAVLFAVAGSPLDPVTWFLCEHGVRPLDVKTPWLWGAVGGFLIAVFFAGTFVRGYRWSRTRLFGKQLEVGAGVGSILLNILITVVVLALTAGLGLPWVYARYRRSFFRSCHPSGREGAPLDFGGAGEEVLGRFCLSLLLLPIGIATGGLLFGVLAWMWMKWELSNVRVPDRNGQMRRLILGGTFGAYYSRWALGWLLSLATAGLYRPWAKAAEWRWIADHTDVS